MEYLQFHTEELPPLIGAGAHYVVVAFCGNWRDGEVTNDAAQIPALQRQLRKRFMNRLAAPGTPESGGRETTRLYPNRNGGVERV